MHAAAVEAGKHSDKKWFLDLWKVGVSEGVISPFHPPDSLRTVVRTQTGTPTFGFSVDNGGGGRCS
eukprot:4472837-Amphidinium_carterae.1